MFEQPQHAQPVIHPALSVFFIILLAGLGFIVGGIVGLFAYMPFFDGGETALFTALQDIENHPELKPALFCAQAGASIGGLILAPMIFLRTQRLHAANYFSGNKAPAFIFALAGLAVIFSFGANSLLMEWNQNLHFPEFMKGFEDWARSREEEAAKQTEALTKLTSVADLIIALLVIAVIPAIGEEFVFRGLIQNELLRGTNNQHVAIWVAAILFSAIHFQFFGFLPRMVLGAIFGYLYYWTSNLWIPIFAHFVNNGVQVLALYLYQRGSFEFDIDDPEQIPATAVALSLMLTAGTLYYLYKYYGHSKPSHRVS